MTQLDEAEVLTRAIEALKEAAEVKRQRDIYASYLLKIHDLAVAAELEISANQPV